MVELAGLKDIRSKCFFKTFLVEVKWQHGDVRKVCSFHGDD
jgi:hypothetical protein